MRRSPSHRSLVWLALSSLTSVSALVVSLSAQAAPSAAHPAKPVRVDAEVTDSSAPPSLLKRNFSSNEINACVDAICGGAQTNWPFLSSLLKRKTETKDYQAFWAQKVAPGLAAAVKADADAEVKVVDRLAKLIQGGQLPKLGHPMQVVAMQTILSNIFITPYLQYLFTPDPVTRIPMIDQNFFNQVLRNAPSLSQRAGIDGLVKGVYLPMIQNTFRESAVGTTNDLTNRLTIRFPNVDASEALKSDAAALLASYEKVREKFGKFTTQRMVDDTAVALIKKAQAGTDLSKVESDAYLKAAQSVETSMALMEPSLYKTLLEIQVDPSKTINNLKKQNAVAKKRADLAKFNSVKRAAGITSVCSGRLSLALSATATPEQYKTLQDAIPEMKKAAKQVAPSFVETASLPALDAAIDKIEFSFPAPATDSITVVQNAIADFAQQASRTSADLSAASGDLDQVLLWSAPELLAQQDEQSEPLIDICNLLPSDEITDLTLTATGRISVSWFSAAYPDMGVAILSHEMGHVVSATIRNIAQSGGAPAAFLSSLNCVANRNPFLIKPVALKFADNTTWSEEDWADHFSVILTKTLAANGFSDG